MSGGELTECQWGRGKTLAAALLRVDPRRKLITVAPVHYTLALAMGACHLPLQGLNQVLLQLLTFNTH